MKQIILILALIITSTSFAQQKLEKKTMSSEPVAVSNEQRIQTITEELDLSKEQQEKLKGIIEKNDEASMKSQRSPEEVESQNKALEKEFRAILTPEQNKKLDGMQRKKAVQSNDTQSLKQAKSIKREPAKRVEE